MTSIDSCRSNDRARRVLSFLLPAVILALAIVPAIPAKAADARAVAMRVSPAYPELAKRLNITGSVKVEATVDPSGNVIDVKALSGNSILKPAAEAAVRRWQFEAGTGTIKVDVDVIFR